MKNKVEFDVDELEFMYEICRRQDYYRLSLEEKKLLDSIESNIILLLDNYYAPDNKVAPVTSVKIGESK